MFDKVTDATDNKKGRAGDGNLDHELVRASRGVSAAKIGKLICACISLARVSIKRSSRHRLVVSPIEKRAFFDAQSLFHFIQ